jgi:hypothetical protein
LVAWLWRWDAGPEGHWSAVALALEQLARGCPLARSGRGIGSVRRSGQHENGGEPKPVAPCADGASHEPRASKPSPRPIAKTRTNAANTNRASSVGPSSRQNVAVSAEKRLRVVGPPLLDPNVSQISCVIHEGAVKRARRPKATPHRGCHATVIRWRGALRSDDRLWSAG